MEKLGIMLNIDINVQTIKHINKLDHTICGSDREITTLKIKFHKLFTTNHTVKNVEVDIQLKDDAKLIEQKDWPIPIRVQQAVGKEIDKLNKLVFIEKAENIKKMLSKPRSYYREKR